MATITLGPLISGISGSIGGTTFSRNGAGLIAKKKITGKKQRTQKQAFAIQRDIALINAWNNLTFADQMNWKTFADANTKTNRYGVVKTLTGFNWFISVSNALVYMGIPPNVDPPTLEYPAFLPEFSLSLSSEAINVDWSIPIDSDDVELFIFSTPPIKGTARYNNGAYRMHEKFTGDYSSSFNILSYWEDAHQMTWSDLLPGANFRINVQIFAIKKSNGITGQAVTAIGAVEP